MAISFGSETLAGYGGYHLPAGTTLTNIRNASGVASSDFRTNPADNDLVPGTGYGVAPPTFNGPYTATLSDGVSTSAVTIAILANTSTVKSHYGFATADNPDTASSNQLRTVLGSTSDIHLGDTVIIRDGAGDSGSTPGINPHDDTYQGVGNDNRYFLRPPATAYASGTGRITIQCETYPAPGALDVNGNEIDGGDCQAAGLIVQGNGTAYAHVIPWDFSHITFYSNYAPTPGVAIAPALLDATGTASQYAEGLGFYYVRVELGPNIVPGIGPDFGLHGMEVNGSKIFHAHFKGPFDQGLDAYSNCTTTHNWTYLTFEGIATDAVGYNIANPASSCGLTYTDSFGFNWQAKDANAVAGDTFAIGGTTYTFVATPTDVAGDIPLGAFAALTAVNTACTIDNGVGPNNGDITIPSSLFACARGVNYPYSQGVADPLVTADFHPLSANPQFYVFVTAKSTGTAGNSIATPVPYNQNWMSNPGTVTTAIHAYNVAWNKTDLTSNIITTLVGGTSTTAASGAIVFAPTHS
jgi:hypothetical protein